MSGGLATLLEHVLGNDGRHELDVTRPEPVLDEARAKVRASAGITTVVTLAGAAGLSATDAGLLAVVLEVLAGAGIAVANAVLTLRAAYAARPLVTPLADPRDAEGQPLDVPLEQPVDEQVDELVDQPLGDAFPHPRPPTG